MMHVVAAGLSDVGRQREFNEDSYCVMTVENLFLVADGMGGHSAGDVASKLATESMLEFFSHVSSKSITWPFPVDESQSTETNRLITGIKLANARIFQTASEDPDLGGMGTTVVGFTLSKDREKMTIAHVGDSRAYRLRGDELVQLTKDHSLLNEYLSMMPDFDPEEIDVPTNVITRALGMSGDVQVELNFDQPKPGDSYLLCSDGLNGMLTDDEIVGILRDCGENVEQAARTLVDAANEAGGEDNVTVVVTYFYPAIG